MHWGLPGGNYPKNLPGDVCREIVEAVNFLWESVREECSVEGNFLGEEGFPRGI